MASLSTFLQRHQSRIRVIRTLPNVPYENIAVKAGQHQLMHPKDFFLSPAGFILDVPDNWETMDSDRTLGNFEFPSEVKFLGGVRFRKEEGLEPVKYAGQFEIQKPKAIQNPKIEVWVGSHSLPIASIRKDDKKFHYENSKTGPVTFFEMEDVLKEIVKLSQIHKGTEPYWKTREQYIREILPDFFKQ